MCADGSSPMLCDKNQCATAKCEGRGDVTCVVDPCNKCQVSFVDASNKPVTCDGKYKNETSVINRCRTERVYIRNKTYHNCSLKCTCYTFAKNCKVILSTISDFVYFAKLMHIWAINFTLNRLFC